MSQNLTRKLIAAHLVEGVAEPGRQISLRIDQTLTQDATGTLVMLALEAMDCDRVQTELSVQYVDHNLLQTDNLNADDHLFLQSACERFGLWFSPPGNGVSHPLHMKYFGVPGKTLLGSDSHTPAAGALGMLAIGAGGIDVAIAMTGAPYVTEMPEIWGIRLTGALPHWVSAKDVILEMLRRHGVEKGVGRVLEYHGPGLDGLTAMDRHVIANMGTELGATATVFPSDEAVRAFLGRHGRSEDWQALQADEGCGYDHEEEIDLSSLEPLIALPSSPGNVLPVREVAGRDIYQAYIGSSANPGYRDFAVVADIMAGRQAAPGVSLDVNPTSRDMLADLVADGRLAALLAAGARLHQAGCNGCIGMGQAPASGRNSLRTVPRNFPDRSGSPEDSVYLCSPETAAASALCGVITDPRDLDMDAPKPDPPDRPHLNKERFLAPPAPEQAGKTDLVKGPNIEEFPIFDRLEDTLVLPCLLRLGDDVSTDEILPGGADSLPHRSNIPKISEFAFRVVDESYPDRARDVRSDGGHLLIAGRNYGQGSSREHAAVAPRYLGLRVVFARSFARIHRQNLINFGILPLVRGAETEAHLDSAAPDRPVRLGNLRNALSAGEPIRLCGPGGDEAGLDHGFSKRESEILLAGGIVNLHRASG